MMKNITTKNIVKLEWRTPGRTLFNPEGKGFWYAEASIGQYTLCFSRYKTETDWFCDAKFLKGLPCFVHGAGSRSCMKQVAKGEMLEALDDAWKLLKQEKANETPNSATSAA